MSTNVSEVARIRDQLERAYRGEAWHGPSLREVLADVDEEAAAKRPMPNAHSIRELVAHVVAWEKEALERLRGSGTDDLPPEKDWPETAMDWDELLSELDEAHERLSSAIGALDDEALAERIGGSPASVYHLLHGVIQHNLYHVGQIAILKKAP